MPVVVLCPRSKRVAYIGVHFQGEMRCQGRKDWQAGVRQVPYPPLTHPHEVRRDVLNPYERR